MIYRWINCLFFCKRTSQVWNILNWSKLLQYPWLFLSPGNPSGFTMTGLVQHEETHIGRGDHSTVDEIRQPSWWQVHVFWLKTSRPMGSNKLYCCTPKIGSFWLSLLGWPSPNQHLAHNWTFYRERMGTWWFKIKKIWRKHRIFCLLIFQNDPFLVFGKFEKTYLILVWCTVKHFIP